MGWRHGSPEERFFRMVNKVQRGCWEWTGYINTRTGYGDFNDGVKTVRVHRFSFFLAGKSLGIGEEVRHTCHNRICVNPKHLKPGTRTQNMADAIKAGRHAFGERNGRSVYPSKDIPKIKQLVASGITQTAVAKIYGMHQSNVSRIVRGLLRKRG